MYVCIYVCLFICRYYCWAGLSQANAVVHSELSLAAISHSLSPAPNCNKGSTLYSNANDYVILFTQSDCGIRMYAWGMF